jgi:8-oxo-dGTP pyrophosphatase MutT (NUDIX family)
VNVIIVDTEDLFLIIQKVGYADNEWNFIGGGREEGESLSRTCTER